MQTVTVTIDPKSHPKLVKTGALHAWAFHPISIPSVGEIHDVSTMLKEFRLCRTRLGENVSRHVGIGCRILFVELNDEKRISETSSFSRWVPIVGALARFSCSCGTHLPDSTLARETE